MICQLARIEPAIHGRLLQARVTSRVGVNVNSRQAHGQGLQNSRIPEGALEVSR